MILKALEVVSKGLKIEYVHFGDKSELPFNITVLRKMLSKYFISFATI